MERTDNSDFSFEIVTKIGVIGSGRSDGWSKELNIVSYNGRDGRVDIRDWSPDHERMSKGLTFTDSEARTLCKLLASAGYSE